jgi:hypothetical protein
MIGMVKAPVRSTPPRTRRSGITTGKPPVALRWVLIRDPQKCFKPQALLATNLEQTCEQILAWFVRRWTMEVTWEEARAHLGMETPRQWNDQAIARTPLRRC